MRSALLSVLLLLEVGSHQSMERSVPSKSSAYRSLVGTLPLLSTLAPALRHRRESACWRPALYCSVCGPRTAASAHGRAAQHQLRGGAGSLEDALEDMGMDDGEASGGRGMAAEEEIDDMGEEDSEFDSGDDAEGPRAKKGSARKKREQQVLDKIARTAQINSTYLSELEKEAAALRKTREEEEEMLAKEERAMRESEDTDELVKEAELIHRDLTGNPNLEGLGDPADDEEPWDELERDEEALRLLSSWAKYKNETDISANISRELKALRQELSEGENGLEYHGKGVGLGARAKELAADDDIGSDEYKLGYTEMLERIFGPGVKAQGWLAPSRFGMQGLEYAVDKEFKAIANDRNLTANVLLRAAAAVGNATAIRRLCQQGGASPGAKDSWLGNVTALHRAASNGHTRAVRELIRLGADVDEVDSTWGRNALHMAARCGHVSTVKALVEAGADVNLTCRRGMTVLEHTVAVLLRRQLQPSSAANAGTEFEPNDAGSTDAVSSSESEMESLENFLTEFGKGTREDHAGRGFREEGAEVDGMREFADVAEMNVVRTRRGGATREEEGQEGVSKKVVSVDSRRARREEDRDLERAEENLLEVHTCAPHHTHTHTHTHTHEKRQPLPIVASVSRRKFLKVRRVVQVYYTTANDF